MRRIAAFLFLVLCAAARAAADGAHHVNVDRVMRLTPTTSAVPAIIALSLPVAKTYLFLRDAPIDGPASATVDLVRDTDHHKTIVLFRARIDGCEGAFLLDSGSVTSSALTAAFAGKCGLPEKEGGVARKPLEIAGFKTAPLALAITARPEKIGEGAVKGDFENIDGIIGWDIFESCKITIDYPAGKITFAPLSDEKAVGEDGKSAVVPFEYLTGKDGKPIRGIFVPGEIETKDGKKQEVMFCIDTGCNSTIIDSATTKGLDLPRVNTLTDTASGKKYDIVQVSSLRLPGLRWRNANMVTYNHGQLQLLRKETGKHVVGLIGDWILRRYIVTFDYRNKQVLFVVPPKK